MQRLELTWIGKDEQPQVESRILLHDPSKDYGDPNAQNMLIHGDDIVNIGLHFFLKNVRPYAASCSEA